MDYSPSPSRVKPQYAFLDNSIEIGRSEKPFKSSPLKNTAANRHDYGLQDMQKKFYNKYSDLKPQDFNSMKPKSASNDTTDRLFKDLGTKVPVDDDVKISSNMVEKIIRENERLKHEKELVQTFAKGLKEKLLKYKQLNDSLKVELAQAQEDMKTCDEKLNEWKTNYEKLQVKYKVLERDSSNSHHEPKSPEFQFNSNNTQDIFGANSSPDKPTTVKPSKTKLTDQGLEAVDARIKFLESTIANNGEDLGSLKSEIEFLKRLMTETQKKADDTPLTQPSVAVAQTQEKSEIESQLHTFSQPVERAPSIIREDDWVVRETFELKSLQTEVAELHKRLAMREDNLRKKSELKRQLLELSMQLERADELPKKTKSSGPSSPVAEAPQRPQQATQEREPPCRQDPSCLRCRKSRNSGPDEGCSHSSTPKSTPGREKTTADSQKQPAKEPKHFHINGVKWY